MIIGESIHDNVPKAYTDLIDHLPDSKEKSLETLPNYDSVVKGRSSSYPNQPVVYSFTGWAQDSMLLMPPPESSNQQPLYRITVELDLNPFLPVSYVTKIFRGAELTSPVVGEFSIALNNKRAVLSMGDFSARLANALYSVNSSPKHFNWMLGRQLHWDCRQIREDGCPLCICYLPPANNPNGPRSAATESIHIATFIPPPLDRSPPLPDASLLVYPMGHQLLDNIVLSALVIERMLTR